MTIREFICRAEAKGAKAHLERLIELSAPAIIIDGWRKKVAELESGLLACSGEVELLDREYTGCTEAKGRGGKVYVKFDGGVLYFPQARYGRFIKREA